MAAGATMYRFLINLSDVERGVYEDLDLRVARHPSESMRHMLVRVLAYGLCHEEGIAFGAGISTNDEPAIWIKELDGRLRVWIEVGAPSAERLHKARKASPRVVVFSHHDPAALARVAAERDIFKVETIEVFAVPTAFLDEIEAVTERHTAWQLSRTGDDLFVTVGDRTVAGALTRVSLARG